MKLNTKEKGFTIIELLVVVAILTILLAIVIPNYIMWRIRAKETSVINNLHIAQVALESWAADHQGNYPNPFKVSLLPKVDATPNDLAYYFPPGWINNPFSDDIYNANGIEEDFFASPVDWTIDELAANRSDDPNCKVKDAKATDLPRAKPVGNVHPMNLKGAIALLTVGNDVEELPNEDISGDDYMVEAYAVVGWGQNPNSAPLKTPKGNVDIYVVLWNKKK